jgi:glyoxylase-like metal-dependent hydrolase (beta-lactamase superfamily II)
MKWKRIILVAGIILVVLLVAAAVYIYPTYKFFFQEGKVAVDKDLTIIQGGGGNSGILVTDSAVIVIDTKMSSDAEKLYQQAKEKAGRKKIIVINTHYHGDHVRGNHFYNGSDIYIGAYDEKFLKDDLSVENMPNRFVKDSIIINLGNEILCLYNLGQAHTWNDMIVLLKYRNVVFTGDLVFYHINPFLKKESGANVDKWIAALDKILRIPGITMFVPGHGQPGDRSIVEAERGYFEDMKAAANDPSKENTMKEKYKDWSEMPMMTSTGVTIDYIRNEK